MTSTGYAAREVTQPPNWHELVVWDFLFNAATTGLFLAAAVADLAKPAAFGPAATWAYPVALVLLTVDLLLLVLDLGHPTRFHHMLRVVKPSSPMSLGTWCLTAYSLPLTVAAAASLFGWEDVRRIAAAGGVLPALGACAYKGVLFSTSSQPGWRDARWLGAYHTITAVAIGAAALQVVIDLTASPDAGAILRRALPLLVLLSVGPTALLLNALMPALTDRYPRWVTNYALLLTLGYWIPAIALALVAQVWADVAIMLLTVASAWLVRAVVVRLPHRHVG